MVESFCHKRLPSYRLSLDLKVPHHNMEVEILLPKFHHLQNNWDFVSIYRIIVSRGTSLFSKTCKYGQLWSPICLTLRSKLTQCSTLDAVMSSGILKAQQKLGVTFNFDKQDVIDLTKISKMTMCRASEANSEK